MPILVESNEFYQFHRSSTNVGYAIANTRIDLNNVTALLEVKNIFERFSKTTKYELYPGPV